MRPFRAKVEDYSQKEFDVPGPVKLEAPAGSGAMESELGSPLKPVKRANRAWQARPGQSRRLRLGSRPIAGPSRSGPVERRPS